MFIKYILPRAITRIALFLSFFFAGDMFTKEFLDFVILAVIPLFIAYHVHTKVLHKR